MFSPLIKFLRKKAPLPRVPQGRRDEQLELRGRALAAQMGCPIVAARLVVIWNSRLSTAAGRASGATWHISLNPLLNSFGVDEVERTFLHELAHLIAFERASGKRIAAHGPEWRRACADLGIPNENVRHALPFPRRKHARRHRYRCPNCGLIVHRARKFRRASACLSCCRVHNRGAYDERFRFIALDPSE